VKTPWTRHEASASPDPGPEPGDELVVYGTAWCGDCYRTRRFLDRNAVPYRWVDLDEHPEHVERVRAINRGHRSVPTLVFPDGSTLTEPSNAELGRKLGLAA
jgi:mycoredoxin